MSIWLLIAAALLAWTLVSAATALWLGRLLRARRRGGTIEIPPFVHYSGPNALLRALGTTHAPKSGGDKAA